MLKLFSLSLPTAGVLLLAGCSNGQKDAPLKPQSFYAEKQQAQASGGTLAANSKALPSPARAASTPPMAPPLANAAAGAPTTRPITSLASGNFMVLGTVVAEANGQPVYADKVLAKLEDALAANARRLEAKEFRLAASDLINRQIMEQVTDELEFAAAQRNTTPEEQQMAAGATTMWRQREITKAGGSQAVARAKSLEDGMDFDERTQQQYRRHLVQIYYLKHVWPKVQVSANDMRRFYERNVEQLYSEKSEVRFRVIRIGFKERGGKNDAWEKAKQILDKARAGYDFAALAAAENDNITWRRNRGYMDVAEKKDAAGQVVKDEKGEPVREPVWVQKNSLRLEDLEKAVFALNSGEITDIIETNEGLYIAKLEEKKTGRTVPFEDLRVQADIRDRMEKEQRFALRLKEQKKLQDAAVWRRDEKNVDLTIDMAMQKFSQSARAN